MIIDVAVRVRCSTLSDKLILAVQPQQLAIILFILPSLMQTLLSDVIAHPLTDATRLLIRYQRMRLVVLRLRLNL